MLHPLTIKLPSGMTVDINEEEWPGVASAGFGRSSEEGNSTGHLKIARHDDGRLLVYVKLVLPVAGNFAGGELLTNNNADVEPAVWRVIERYGVPIWAANSCLERFRKDTCG